MARPAGAFNRLQMQPLPRHEPVGLLIAAARRGLRQAAGKVARRFKLPPQQFWVLNAVLETDGPSLRELADRMRIDEPTASRIVAALVRRKLVRMDAHARDRRRARLVATTSGEALRADVAAAAAEMRVAIVAGFSAAEQDVLRDGLRRVIANMERFGGTRPARSARAPRGAT